MKTLHEIKEQYRHWNLERKYRRVQRCAQEIFQIKEYDGELWFTHGDLLFCPCSMIHGEATEALAVMRKKYVTRNMV